VGPSRRVPGQVQDAIKQAIDAGGGRRRFVWDRTGSETQSKRLSNKCQAAQVTGATARAVKSRSSNAQPGEEASEKKPKEKQQQRHEWKEYDDLTTITTIAPPGEGNHNPLVHLPSRLVSSTSQPLTTVSRTSLRRSHPGATPSKALLAVSPDLKHLTRGVKAASINNSPPLVSSSFAGRPSNPSVRSRRQSE
jgi:hypothetical protein